MTAEVKRDFLSYDNQAGSFHSWSAEYQAAERALALLEKGYKDAMRDFEEHRYGLGERLREAKMKIIDVEPEKNSSAAAKAAAQSSYSAKRAAAWVGQHYFSGALGIQ